MKYLIDENFKDFKLDEFPYDKFHTALGEYHHIVQEGYYGNFYDPIPLHQWRSTDGSWLITEEDGKRYLEQNRGDTAHGAFKNVFATLVHKEVLYSTYVLEYSVRLFSNNLCGMAFSYHTSRDYYACFIDKCGIYLYKRYEETLELIDKYDIEIDDLKTYRIKICTGYYTSIYLDGVKVINHKINFKYQTKIAFVSKALARFSDLKLYMSDFEYKEHLKELKVEKKRLENKRLLYPKLKLIHQIDLKNYGSGRQLRIANVDGKTIFVIAQHQKRYIRDSFASISCLTAFDINSNVLWQIGEANNNFSNTLISCDLPFQIADINNDGKLELIYAKDFYINIIDLLTGKLINKFPTPIIEGDPLVKDEPFIRLNVDQIRVADFEGLGYKGDLIIKDRYQNVWALDKNMNILWRYHNKNTGHFPYVFDYNNDGYDEVFIGYDLVSHKGEIIFDLKMNSDHTDEIIYAKLDKDMPERLILASGNEGLNIVNMDGTIFKHNEIGHAQRISVAKYDNKIDGLQIMATSFWGSDGIIGIYDKFGNLIKNFEMETCGSLVSPINYDGFHILALTHAGIDGGLLDSNLDMVVKFPDDGHPTLTAEVYDIDNDGIDEIITFDTNKMYIYKASSFTKGKDYIKYPSDSFSNYRGEYLLPKE